MPLHSNGSLTGPSIQQDEHEVSADITTNGWNSPAQLGSVIPSFNHHGLECLFYVQAGEPVVRSAGSRCGVLHANPEKALLTGRGLERNHLSF